MKTATLFKTDVSQIIADRDLPDSIAEMIQQQIARLRQEYSDILHCQVSANIPAFCQAGIYQIQIVLKLADRDLTIDREPIPDYYQEDIYVAIWSAFDLARKKLQAYSLIQNDRGTSTAPLQKNAHPPIRCIRRCVGYAQG
jgi:ribosome-associated translation inhibitor RaiA